VRRRVDGATRRTTLAAIAAEAGVSYPRAGVRRHRRSGLIDLVFNGLDSPWAVEILRGVEERGDQHETGVAVSAVRHGRARPASWSGPVEVLCSLSPLTTVRQPLAEMGRAAGQMLGDLIAGIPLGTNRIELSTELIVRESTADPMESCL
jgi:DNA-binding LacI/PurR family transcriptional regulator